ncbi:glycosyltransferase [Nocardioides sp. GY 10113]|uniref:glycosyltransferase n=1 Tax=Nocardioides sp. GY 10113 TaxID=2569761 RepID=UPI0010A7A0F8|nr:glycosyltransferase [Nocardioides sp. GY 10113]TIC88320.1 glycosyltransferase [Nocardioides sp. GY 10113]
MISPEQSRLGAVIVPAHNEEAVVARTLAPLSDLATSGRIELIVVANGCTDGTAQVARAVPGAQVLEVETASKVAALNAGDSHASTWPRMYLDADIEITAVAVERVLSLLTAGPALAARPAFRYEATGATRVVRSFYRARQRLPEISDHLWGAGVYALSKSGHERFDRFPERVGDDLFVDGLFDRKEIEIVATDPVLVRTPRDLKSLMAVLRRTHYGRAEAAKAENGEASRPTGRTTSGIARQLLTTTFEPAADSAVYAGLVVAARLQLARGRYAAWERDHSSRGGAASIEETDSRSPV